MVDIHIRVADDVNAKLVKQAKVKRKSRNELVNVILSDYVINPEIKAIENRYENLVKDITALYENALERTREQLEENNYCLKKIIDKL